MNISQYIDANMSVCFYYEDMVQNLTNEKIEEIIRRNTIYRIKEVGEHYLIYDKYYVDLDMIIYHTIFIKDNKPVDISLLRKEFKERYPNHDKFNSRIINEYIKKGYKYIFNPHLSEEIELKNIDKEEMFAVSHIDIGGVCSNGGFLDIEDTLFKCIFFDMDGNKIDISHLQNLYMNRWKK